MSARIKIGDTLFDLNEDAGASDSTIAGVIAHLPEDGLNVVDTPERVSFEFLLGLHGMADAAAVKAAIEELDTAVRALSGDVEIYSDAAELYAAFRTSDGTFSRLAIETRKYSGDNHGIIEVSCVLTRPVDSLPNPGLPSGALDVFNWQHDPDVDGLGGAIGTFNFKTRADALAYKAQLDAGVRPAWLHANMRLRSVALEVDEPETGEFQPARLVATYLLFPQWAAGLPASLKGLFVQVQVTPRILDNRAGHEPGYDALVTGSMEFRVFDDTTAFPGQSGAVAVSQLRQLANDVIDVVMLQAADSVGEGVVIELSRALPQLDLRSGSVRFEVTGVTGRDNRILSWREAATFNIIDRSVKVFHSAPVAGKRFTRFEHAGGPEITVKQAGRIEALGFARTLPPPLSIGRGDWRPMVQSPGVPVMERTQDGRAVWISEATNEWEWDGEGTPPGLPSGRETVARR